MAFKLLGRHGQSLIDESSQQKPVPTNGIGMCILADSTSRSLVGEPSREEASEKRRSVEEDCEVSAEAQTLARTV